MNASNSPLSKDASQYCETVQEALFAQLDEDSTFNFANDAERATFETHLAECLSCQDYQKHLSASISALDEMAAGNQLSDIPGLSDPSALSERIMAYVGEHATPTAKEVKPLPDNVRSLHTEKTGNKLFQWGSIAAAVALIALAIPVLTPYLSQSGQYTTELGQIQSTDMGIDTQYDLLAGTSSTEVAESQNVSADPIEILVGF